MHDGYHDIGGHPAGPIEKKEHHMMFWERRTEAMRDLLAKRAEPLVRTDELRRRMETIGEETYNALTFYERKALSLRDILVEKGIIDRDELERQVAIIDEQRNVAVAWVPESGPRSGRESGLDRALEGERDEPETLYT